MSEKKARQRRQRMRARGESTEKEPVHNVTAPPYRRELRRKARGEQERPKARRGKGRTLPLPDHVRFREWAKKTDEQREKTPKAKRPKEMTAARRDSPVMLGWLLISAAFGALAFALVPGSRSDTENIGIGLFVALLLAGIGFVVGGVLG